MMSLQRELLARLSDAEQLAHGSKMKRFLHGPYRYTTAILYSKLFYRFSQQSLITKVRTCFDYQMLIELPGSIDIYLLGCKTHDSEIRLCRFLIRYVQPGQKITDVGAHFGFFSLLASLLVGKHGQVFAFEPSGNNFRILEKNVGSAGNIIPINKAVNDNHRGTTEFYEFPARLSEFSSIFVSQLDNKEWIDKATLKEIESLSLDGFFSENQQFPDFVKIDVEGAEYLVISGMTRTLEQNRPFIIMEYLINPSAIGQYEKAANLLYQSGYQAHSIQSDGSLANIKDINQHLQEKKLQSENIVFVHRKKDY